MSVVKAMEEMSTQREGSVNTGMKAKELEIPTFSGETGQYQEWKRQAKAITDNMDLEDNLKNLFLQKALQGKAKDYAGFQN